jgi:membrane protease YdiL (CAAX protease family)
MSLSPTAARSPGITDWVREHRTAVFFGLTFLLSWWAWPFYLVGLAPTAFFPCGPLVAAIVVVGVTEGARGYRDWGARLVRWRVGWVWWVVAIGTPLAVLALASAANVAIWGAPAPVLTALPWSSIALFAALRLVNPLDGPFGEEPGWRGYALPELQVRRSPLAAGLVLAPIVALWHLPLVTTGQLAAVASPSRSPSPWSTSGCSTAPAAACCSPSPSTSRRARSATACWASQMPTPPGWTGSSACCGSPSLPR